MARLREGGHLLCAAFEGEALIGIRLPTGEIVPKVPFSVFWLVEGDEFIGETHVRHQLNDYLVKEGGHVGYGIRPARRRQG